MLSLQEWLAQRKMRGIIVTLIVLVVLEIVTHRTRFNVVNPGLFLLIAVVYAAFIDGMMAGLVSGTLGFLYSLYFFSRDGRLFTYTPDDLTRVIALFVSTYAIVYMTGWLKQQNDLKTRQQEQQRLQELQEDKICVFADAFPNIIWTMASDGTYEYFNNTWYEFSGLTRVQTFDHTITRSLIHPEDIQRVLERWCQSRESGQSLEIEYRLKSKAGEFRWFMARIVPVKNAQGAVIKWFGSATDIHKQRKVEAELENSKRQLEAVLANVADGLVVRNFQGRILFTNGAALRIFGVSSVEELSEFLSSDVSHGLNFRDIDNRPVHMQKLFMPTPGKNGTGTDPQIYSLVGNAITAKRWVSISATSIVNSPAAPDLYVSVIRDITNERKAIIETERLVAQQEFLARAGELLTSSLDHETTLKSLTRLIVPRLAEWTVVHLVQPDGAVVEVAAAHVDQEKERRLVKTLGTRKNEQGELATPSWMLKVVQTGKPEFHPIVNEQTISAITLGTEHTRMIRETGIRSIMVVPLKNLDQVIGTISFAYTDTDNHFSESDLQMAEELARRASIAIQNSKLYHQAREIASREHEHAALTETLLGNAPVGFGFVSLDYKFLQVNNALAAMNSVSPRDLLDRRLSEVLPDLAEVVEPQYDHVVKHGEPVVDYEISGYTPDNPERLRHWFYNFFPVRNTDSKLSGIGIIVAEVTDRKEAEREIHYRAYHDILTGLPNRKYFDERLAYVLHRSKRDHHKFAVLFIDMDRLKNINDSLGHDIGDTVIRELAERLKKTLRAGDVVARWGGDEFVILLPELSVIADAVKVAEKILKTVEPSLRIGVHTLHMTVSIGIAVFPNDGEDVQTLQKNADIALYRAKEAGKNRYELYNQQMNVKASERLALENDLRQALAKCQMDLYYQPIQDLKTGRIVSVETLLRWRHPRFGLLSPLRFLPIAEETGIISQLGSWVIDQAVSHMAELNLTSGPMRFSINISARQFSEGGLVAGIIDRLQAHQCSPELLDIEITESLAMENLDRTRNTLDELKQYGISITVDDFGTGYSSLNYLKRLPIDRLKIDKSFVRHVLTDEQDTSIIKAITSMAESLHLKVVAEGVDTEMQLNLLRSLGCHAVQGYHISRPLSRHELVAFLNKKNQEISPVQTQVEEGAQS